MKRFYKRLLTAALSIGLVLTMSVSVPAAAAVTEDEAVAAALADAGLNEESVSGLQSERDGKCYEIEFADAKTGDRYEYEIYASSGTIKEAEVEYAHRRNTSRKKITRTEALKIASKASGVSLSTVKKGSCKYKKDDGEWIYKIRFTSGSYRYEYEILAPTGQIIEYSRTRRK